MFLAFANPPLGPYNSAYSLTQQVLEETKENQKGKFVQRMLNGFLANEEKEESSQLNKIQADVNRILLMVEDLTVESKGKSKVVDKSNRRTGSLNEIPNLLEWSHPDILVEILDDGMQSNMYSM